jgi:hypothetical protein
MYYRNANCAVVVYDITQAVRIISTVARCRVMQIIFDNNNTSTFLIDI